MVSPEFKLPESEKGQTAEDRTKTVENKGRKGVRVPEKERAMGQG